MAETILIVEDETSLAEDLEVYLRHEGYRTERAADGRRALELWRATQPDLILLDLMLPVIDGLEVARRVRAESEVPIIMLTARDQEVDKLVGLGLGADDYIVKPYSPREVVARVRAVLRRAGGGVRTPNVYRVGRLEINLETFEVHCDELALHLTHGELDLLALLARKVGVVHRRVELLAATGNNGDFSDDRAVDTHIKNLRRKLGACAEMLETVRGVGYRLKG